MSHYVFHGRSPSDDAWGASILGGIEGQTVTVYEVEIPEPDEARQYRARNLYDLPGQVVGAYPRLLHPVGAYFRPTRQI